MPTLLARVARKLPKCKALSMRRLGRKPFILIDQVEPILIPHPYIILFIKIRFKSRLTIIHNAIFIQDAVRNETAKLVQNFQPARFQQQQQQSMP